MNDPCRAYIYSGKGCRPDPAVTEHGDCEHYLRQTYSKRPPATRRHTPPPCPDCGGPLATRRNYQKVLIYECDSPGCEFIYAHWAPGPGFTMIHREARAGRRGEAPEVENYSYPPKPCPECGVVARARVTTACHAPQYVCENPRCWVSRFNVVGGELKLTRKTSQFHKFLRANKV